MLRRTLFLALGLLTAGCSSAETAPGTLTLATTTSTQDSGLLDVLLPPFEAATGIDVKVVAVGSGQALALGRRGDADVLLTHDPDGEQRFMDEKHGIRRDHVMHNDFVLVGPPDDPAGVKGESSAAAAFAAVARKQATFVSRGDESGTHQKERAVWRQAGVEPKGEWYLRAGAGMGAVLRLAGEKRAYTLTDRGTYLAQRQGLGLEVLSQGDPLLTNPYSVIVVSAEKHPGVRQEAATRFADYLLGPEAQKIIGEFGVKQHGHPLFFGRAQGPERQGP